MRKRHDKSPAAVAAKPPGMAGRAWPYALLVAIAVAFCGRAIFTGKALAPLDMLLLMAPWKSYAWQFPHFVRPQAPMLDPVQQYFPWRIFAVSSLKQGVLPLWDPYAFSGTPFVANLQSAILYPPNILFLIMPIALGFTCTAALHLALAGCFMLFFLRVWGISRWPAIIASAAYMLNGYFVAWLEYPAIGLWVAVWLPLLLALYELSLRRRSWLLTVMAGLVIGVFLLGGHLQVAAYVLLACFLYALARTIWPMTAEGEPALRRWDPLVRGAVALALGLLLAAGQLLPTLELAPRSHRPPVSAVGVQTTALPFTHLALYFVPKFFGTAADYNYWGNIDRPAINFFETSGYVGVLPLMLAFFGVLEWRRPLAKYLLALAVISLLLELGTPLYLALHYAVPGFKQLAGVARIMCLTAFALTGLAALGLERLSRREPVPVAAVIAAFALIGGAFVGADWVRFRPQIIALGQSSVSILASFPHYLAVQVGIFVALAVTGAAAIAFRAALRPARLGVICLAVVLADLFVAWAHFNPVNDPRMAYFETGATTYLREHADGDRMLSIGRSYLDWMPPNTPTAYSLRDIQGSDSLWWGRYFRFLNATQAGAPTFDWANLSSPGLKMLAVSQVLSTRRIADPAWELAYDRDALIYRSRAPVARARLYADWGIASAEDALRSVKTGDQQILVRPLVSDDPGIARDEGAQPGAATIIADGINAVTIRCRTPAPRLLVLFDPDYPGWQAKVDGEARPHHTANYVFRAVAVPAGEHLVTWRYQPAGFRLGLFGGMIGSAILLAVVGLNLPRGRRGR